MATQPIPIYGRYNGYGVNDQNATGEKGIKIQYGPDGRPIYDPTDPDNGGNGMGNITNRFFQDAAQINSGAEQINQTAQNQLGHYGNRQVGQENLSDEALQQLKETPGYNPDEASKIGTDYGQYRTNEEQLQWQYGDPFGVQRKAEEGNAAQGTLLNQYQEGLSGQVQNYGDQTNAGLGELGEGLQYGLNKLDTGLNAAQGKFGKLDAAVNDPSLGFDPNGTQKQLTDENVQQIKDAAGRRVGNMYRSQEDDISRRAAADGNASPLAIAAARSRLANNSAAAMGDSEADANIKALQAQYDRAAGIEGQRLGATQTQAGMRATAATTEQAQAQRAAELAGTEAVNAGSLYGTQALAARQRVGQTGIDAVNNYGKTSVQTAGEMADRAYGAANNADIQGTQRVTNINQQRYGQGMDTAQANSKGAQVTGDARITGQNNYRSGVSEQQQMAQQGGQKAVDQQLGAYGTKVGGLTTTTANRADFENTGPGALGKMGGQLLSAVASAGGQAAGGYLSKHAEGGTVTKDELARIGESGPEMVYGRYGAPPQLVDEPIIAKMEEGDTVVPLNNNPRNKATMRYRAA